MVALHAARKGRGSGSAAPRVDWPVYPRRAEHNTVAEGGIRDLPSRPQAGSGAGPVRWPRSRSPTLPSSERPGNRLERLDGDGDGDQASGPPRQRSTPAAFFVFAPQRSPQNRWATSSSHVGQTTQWPSSSLRSNMLITIVLSSPIGRPGISTRAAVVRGKRLNPEPLLSAPRRAEAASSVSSIRFSGG
jgi:hypothetical protein